MSKAKDHTFLGKGWAFPLSFDFYEEKVKMVAGEEDIKQSLIILFSTIKKERVMRPDYGSELAMQVFEQMDTSRYHFIVDLVKNAIALHEPRIDVEHIELDTELEKLLIAVTYRVRSTNTRHNLVYPYFIGQGTNIEHYDRIY